MTFIERLKALLHPKPVAPQRSTELIYVYLPEDLGPLDRGARYEDALDDELELAGLGYVSGGGSSLGDAREDGTRPVEFCGIDVDVVNVDAGRTLLRDLLPRLGCRPRTALWYRENDQPLQDEYDGSGWELARPRSNLHPGFGF